METIANYRARCAASNAIEEIADELGVTPRDIDILDLGAVYAPGDRDRYEDDPRVALVIHGQPALLARMSDQHADAYLILEDAQAPGAL